LKKKLQEDLEMNEEHISSLLKDLNSDVLDYNEALSKVTFVPIVSEKNAQPKILRLQLI